MVVPFGVSVGDFIAGIGVVLTVVQALRDVSGASVDFRELTAETESLKAVFVTIENADLDPSSRDFKCAEQAIENCKAIVSTFKTNQTRKAKWVLLYKNDVEEFRRRLSTHRSTVDLIVSAIILKQSTHASETQISLLEEIARRLYRRDTEQQELLERIERLLIAHGPTPQRPTFRIRPLKLTGSPLASNNVDRRELMSKLESALLPNFENDPESNRVTVALVGLGGVGKSQLARDFAVKHQENYSAIFWLNAKTEQTLRLSIAQVAEQIPLIELLDAANKVRRSDLGRAIGGVKAWFGQESNDKWLLIIDNVDSHVAEEYQDELSTGDVGSKHAITAKTFDVFRDIPDDLHGSILVTTRLPDLSTQIGATPISVGEMSLNEGMEVLARTSQRKPNELGMKELAQRLGLHVLALSLAGTYMSKALIGPSKYLSNWKRRLFQRDSPLSTTLNPSAAALLILCGCFSSSDISFELFQSFAKFPEGEVKSIVLEQERPFVRQYPLIPNLSSRWLEDLCSDSLLYDERISSLHELSFITRLNEESDSISIHPLVHEWSILHLDGETRKDFVTVACDILGAAKMVYGGKGGMPYSRLQDHVDRWWSLKPELFDHGKGTVRGVLAIADFYGVRDSHSSAKTKREADNALRVSRETARTLRSFAYDIAKGRYGSNSYNVLLVQGHIIVNSDDLEERVRLLGPFLRTTSSFKNEDNSINPHVIHILCTMYPFLVFCLTKLERFKEARMESEEFEKIAERFENMPNYPFIRFYSLLLGLLPKANYDSLVEIETEDIVKVASAADQVDEWLSMFPNIFESLTTGRLYRNPAGPKARLLQSRGLVYIAQPGNMEKGQRCLQEALRTWKKADGASSPVTLRIAQTISTLALSQKDPPQLNYADWNHAVWCMFGALSLSRALPELTRRNRAIDEIPDRLPGDSSRWSPRVCARWSLALGYVRDVVNAILEPRFMYLWRHLPVPLHPPDNIQISSGHSATAWLSQYIKKK